MQTKLFKRFIYVMLSIATLVGLSACNTMAGMGRDLQSLGSKIDTTPQSKEAATNVTTPSINTQSIPSTQSVNVPSTIPSISPSITPSK